MSPRTAIFASPLKGWYPNSTAFNSVNTEKIRYFSEHWNEVSSCSALFKPVLYLRPHIKVVILEPLKSFCCLGVGGFNPPAITCSRKLGIHWGLLYPPPRSYQQTALWFSFLNRPGPIVGTPPGVDGPKDGQGSQGLPQATPTEEQHSALVISDLISSSQPPLNIRIQHEPRLWSAGSIKSVDINTCN